jgi:hypothetical protein
VPCVRSFWEILTRDADLLLGVGKHQTKVEIVREEAVKSATTEPVRGPPPEPRPTGTGGEQP